MQVEPNDYFNPGLQKSIDAHPELKVERLNGQMEDLSAVPSESIDNVVMTLVMCTVHDVEKGLQEVLRVLKPGTRIHQSCSHALTYNCRW